MQNFLYIISLDHLEANLPCWQILPDTVIQHAAKMHHKKDQIAFLSGKWMVENFIGPLQNLQFNPYGKPYLSGKPSFNLSHSENLLLFSISKDHHIGVDTEQIREIDIKDYTSVLHPNESAYIDNDSHRFYTIWCRKEALLKCYGIGLCDHMNTIDVTTALHYFENSFTAFDFTIGDSYAGSLAAPRPFSHIHVSFGYFTDEGFCESQQETVCFDNFTSALKHHLFDFSC